MKQNKNILRAALLLLLVIVAPEARAQQLITANGDGTYTITMPDYTVTAPSGTVQNTGNYTYTITGAGNYSGETTATFTIPPGSAL